MENFEIVLVDHMRHEGVSEIISSKGSTLFVRGADRFPDRSVVAIFSVVDLRPAILSEVIETDLLTATLKLTAAIPLIESTKFPEWFVMHADAYEKLHAAPCPSSASLLRKGLDTLPAAPTSRGN